MSETELCKKIRKFGVPTLRKCLFRVNNRRFEPCDLTAAFGSRADIVALKAEVAVDTSKYSIDRNSHTSVGGIMASLRCRS